MAALGGKGMGLFTPSAEDVDSNISDERISTPYTHIGSPREVDKWTKIVDKKTDSKLQVHNGENVVRILPS